jgi:Glycine-rich domain-containing protein-like
MMHTHMLSPVEFANDIVSSPRCSSLAGTIDLPLMRLYDKLRNIDRSNEQADRALWRAKYKSDVYHLFEVQVLSGQKSIPPEMLMNMQFAPKKYRFTKPPPFSIDLVDAVKRQIAFARKITTMYPYDPVPDTLLLDSQQRYAKFMNLIRLNATQTPVPALDIDLFWHTHQLTSSNYFPWCTRHIGRPINRELSDERHF